MRPNRARAARSLARMAEGVVASQIDRPSLDEKLRQAKAVYDRATDPSDRRAALGYQIGALMEFMDLNDAWREAGLTAPLRDLLTAFVSLDAGAVEPLVRPAPKGRGRPSPANHQLFRAYAGAASAVLLRGDWPEQAADGWVARALSDAGHRKSAGAREDRNLIQVATIAGWRKEARESGGLIHARYEKWLAAPDIGDPEADARYIIDCLIRRFPVAHRAPDRESS